MWTDREFERRIAFFERNIERAGLATTAEIAAVALRSKEWAIPERLIYHWADLRALLVERNKTTVDPDALEAATQAMEERPEWVTLPTVDRVVAVRPASFERITMVEQLDFNLKLLQAARTFLMFQRAAGKRRPKAPEPCGECKRPYDPEGAFDLIERMGREADFARASLYTQIIADGPEPHDGPLVDWSKKLTGGEHMLLLQAYHRVNTDPILRVSKLVSSDGKRDLPMSWSFLFATMEEREHRPAKEIMRDRSLASIVAVCVVSALQHREMEKKAKERAERDARQKPGKGKGKSRAPWTQAVERGGGGGDG